MPTPILRLGKTTTGTSFGQIDVRPLPNNSDTAVVTIKIKGQNARPVTLKAYYLSDLKKLPLFQTAPNIESESLVHLWETKKTGPNIIKYSGKDELGFVFTEKDDVDDSFSKFLEASFHFEAIDYFREIGFVQFLTEMKISIEQLKEINGMNEARIIFMMQYERHVGELLKAGITFTQLGSFEIERIKLLLSNVANVQKILKRGVTFEQIGSVNLDILRKFADSSTNIDDIFAFVTLNQILGIDHAPPYLPALNNSGSITTYPEFLSIGSGRLDQHFSYCSRDNGISITHTDSKTNIETKLEICTQKPNKELVAALANAMALMEPTLQDAPKPEKLIRDWYYIDRTTDKETNKVETNIYNKDVPCLIKETCDLGFPEEEFKKTTPYCLVVILYYDEKFFAEWLAKNNTSLDELRNIKGMTFKKIDLMRRNITDIGELLKLGMTFENFGLIDEKRFKYILLNFHKARDALKFVDVFELFGLRDSMAANYSPSLFQHNVATSSTSSTSRKELSCRLL